jgi:hypothetical protein
MNVLHKSGKPHLLLTNSSTSSAASQPGMDGPQLASQMKLPMPAEEWQEAGQEDQHNDGHH